MAAADVYHCAAPRLRGCTHPPTLIAMASSTSSKKDWRTSPQCVPRSARSTLHSEHGVTPHDYEFSFDGLVDGHASLIDSAPRTPARTSGTSARPRGFRPSHLEPTWDRLPPSGWAPDSPASSGPMTPDTPSFHPAAADHYGRSQRYKSPGAPPPSQAFVLPPPEAPRKVSRSVPPNIPLPPTPTFEPLPASLFLPLRNGAPLRPSMSPRVRQVVDSPPASPLSSPSLSGASSPLYPVRAPSPLSPARASSPVPPVRASSPKVPASVRSSTSVRSPLSSASSIYSQASDARSMTSTRIGSVSNEDPTAVSVRSASSIAVFTRSASTTASSIRSAGSSTSSVRSTASSIQSAGTAPTSVRSTSSSSSIQSASTTATSIRSAGTAATAVHIASPKYESSPLRKSTHSALSSTTLVGTQRASKAEAEAPPPPPPKDRGSYRTVENLRLAPARQSTASADSRLSSRSFDSESARSSHFSTGAYESADYYDDAKPSRSMAPPMAARAPRVVPRFTA